VFKKEIYKQAGENILLMGWPFRLVLAGQYPVCIAFEVAFRTSVRKSKTEGIWIEGHAFVLVDCEVNLFGEDTNTVKNT
jgi:hypothetical protein